MLLRMYQRWAENKAYECTCTLSRRAPPPNRSLTTRRTCWTACRTTVDVVEVSENDVGIKSALVKCSGEYAFGWLKVLMRLVSVVCASENSPPSQPVCVCALWCRISHCVQHEAGVHRLVRISPFDAKVSALSLSHV